MSIEAKQKGNASRPTIIVLLLFAIGAALLRVLPLEGVFDSELILASLSITVIKYPAALISLILTMKTFDYVSGIKFGEAWKDMTMGQGVYLGLRFAGSCYLVASVYA